MAAGSEETAKASSSPRAEPSKGETPHNDPGHIAVPEAETTTESGGDKNVGEDTADEVVTSTGDKNWVEDHNNTAEPTTQDGTAEAPPLPEETLPPLPNEAPPSAGAEVDDGWAPLWEETAKAFYFYNRFTGATQWTNPRVPDPTTLPQETAPGVTAPAATLPDSPPPSTGTTGYNPAIHGDYDPTAWYAQPAATETPVAAGPADPNAAYAATAAFNRFTGRFQASEITPELHNDENKSKRQMNAFFDVDAAANNHDGRSLKAERSGKKLTKTELKQFKEKRKAKKEEKRRAWLLD
ncbi:hypothetical protein GLAREA_06497 [Glarea lozoyensis ATCC 20868]|uniref:WW domain-containing protein n=2 Tax=Glarea lozoyensis TaxID=101852 RepID=S3D8J7_GLAL2|nr:uncharacterized protein GLAREA_06497 [Glarea lozoyensis ATCC 20868]EPE33484.1 hypothetical protein GLAREA_06497 [Glarea lozoyensis ATCC 20868]